MDVVHPSFPPSLLYPMVMLSMLLLVIWNYIRSTCPNHCSLHQCIFIWFKSSVMSSFVFLCLSGGARHGKTYRLALPHREAYWSRIRKNLCEISILIVSVVTICKQCLQTDSASGGLRPLSPTVPQTPWAVAPKWKFRSPSLLCLLLTPTSVLNHFISAVAFCVHLLLCGPNSQYSAAYFHYENCV